MRTATALPLLRAILLWPLAAAGCRTTIALPERPPDIVGTVTQVAATPAEGAVGTLRIEENPADSAGSARYVVTLTRSTMLVVRPGEITERLDFGDVVVGQRVHAWITGPVRESYPMQATASHVLVLGDDEGAERAPRR